MNLLRTLFVSILFTFILLGLTITPSSASSVAYLIANVDTSGNPVSGVTLSVGGVALSPGTPATVTGKLLATGAAVTGSVTLVDFNDGTGHETLNYDPVLTGEAHFAVTLTKTATTFAGGSLLGVNFTADSSTILSGLTSSIANGTAITGTPAATIAAIKADTILTRTFNRSFGKYTYNSSTHIMSLIKDDGTPLLGSDGTTPVTLTISSDTAGVINSKQ